MTYRLQEQDLIMQDPMGQHLPAQRMAYNMGRDPVEERFEYFIRNYLPKNEVLYQLPLGISINTFWPELLNRRKARAVVLPLRRSNGMPYWYNMTDTMIAASERICTSLSMGRGRFDPYRMEMTPAMTQEMYFTSFVEGAQIRIEDAMHFLSSAAAPTNIYEQMLDNNRNAWDELLKMLPVPIDEEYTKYLAYVLTENMDNCADDYRQADWHQITAMREEPYSLPPAAAVPHLMSEYYAFMQDRQVHPLIKSAVGAAYILVTRPFPEGNERLSRIISSAVLLKSGYDRFKDISLSSVIATENYEYYKSMCEIIRDENEGDLTYFVEYYLQLLSKALDKSIGGYRLEDAPSGNGSDAIQHDDHYSKGQGFMSGGYDDVEQLTSEARQDNQIEGFVFNPDEWKSVNNRHEFSQEPEGAEPAEELLYAQGGAEFAPANRAETVLAKLAEANCMYTSRQELEKLCDLSTWQARKTVEDMEEKGMLKPEGTVKGNVKIYRIVMDWDDSPDEKMPSKRTYSRKELIKCVEVETEKIMKMKKKLPGPFRDHLLKMLEECSIHSIRAVQFLTEAVKEKRDSFEREEWEKFHDVRGSARDRDISIAVQYGLIERVGGQHEYVYSILLKPGAIREVQFTETQRNVLRELYNEYGMDSFSTGGCAEILKMTKDGAYYHLTNFRKRGLVDVDHSGAVDQYYFTDEFESSREEIIGGPEDGQRDQKQTTAGRTFVEADYTIAAAGR